MFNEKYARYDNTYWVYLRSRLLRVYPIYWLVFLFTAIVYFLIPQLRVTVLAACGNDLPYTLINNFIVLSNNFNNKYWFIGSAWSLGIELQFYLIAPIIFLALKNKKVSVVLLVVSSLVAIGSIYYSLNMTRVDSIVTYLPYFIIGGLIYTWDFKASYGQASISLLLVVGILLVNYSIPYLRNNFLLNRQAQLVGFNYREGLNVVLTLLMIPYIVFNVKQELAKSASDAIMSSMSYVVYLLHWPLLQVYAITVQNVGFLQKAIHLVAYYVACIALSFLISRYFDQAFEMKRRNWLKKMRYKQEIAINL
jgi:peptidoglycan/LPS O-acetylase OafA/YrhL